MERFPARLHVLLARDALKGVVIRRGPSRRVATLLWDLQTHAFIDEYTTGGAAVWGIAVAPDRGLIAAACDDHVVRVCTTAPFEPIATFTAEEPVFAIGWARGDLLLAGSAGSGRVYPLRLRRSR